MGNKTTHRDFKKYAILVKVKPSLGLRLGEKKRAFCEALAKSVAPLCNAPDMFR